ncbi:hypothetical protein [Caballeronia sp. J97]|uniref:hypothetical protein n=1 Tax=Caballeronia sp. J97 TaxID=2805429 RepID=UPI002AAFD1C2|nr:hypothetical protein [Caballeronia sp. J97]
MKVDLDLALRAAINALRDIAESKRMPNGIALTNDECDLHWDCADELEEQRAAMKDSVARLRG